MGWLKKLLGTPEAAGHAPDLKRPPRQGSPPASRISRLPQNNLWTPLGLRRRPPCAQRGTCGLSVRATARMPCDGSWLEWAYTGSCWRNWFGIERIRIMVVPWPSLWGRITLATSAETTLAMKANPSTRPSLGWLNVARPLRAGRG
jgi:hypothetical protein